MKFYENNKKLTSASSSKISNKIRQYSRTHSTTHVHNDFIPRLISLLISLCSGFWILTLNVTPDGRAKKLLWSRIKTVLLLWWSILLFKLEKNLSDDSFLYSIGSRDKPFKTVTNFKYQVDGSASKVF